MKYAAVINHYGDDYVSGITNEDEVEWIEATCGQCGDSDMVVGLYDTEEEAEQGINEYYKDRG